MVDEKVFEGCMWARDARQDGGPRLVYADWFEERGDGVAVLMRKGVEVVQRLLTMRPGDSAAILPDRGRLYAVRDKVQAEIWSLVERDLEELLAAELPYKALLARYRQIISGVLYAPELVHRKGAACNGPRLRKRSRGGKRKQRLGTGEIRTVSEFLSARRPPPYWRLRIVDDADDIDTEFVDHDREQSEMPA